MAKRTTLWLAAGLVAVLLMAAAQSPALACPFCGAVQGKTLVKEVQDSAFVVFGTLSNPRTSVNADGTENSSTDLLLEAIVKDHAFLKEKKQIVLPRYLFVDPKNPVKYLVFCDFYQNRVDPYRGIPSKTKDMVEYLQGALKLDEKNPSARLHYFFHYLDHDDLEISTDAFREFASSDYKYVAEMLRDHGSTMRERLAGLLRNKTTPQYLYGLLGMMLGHCGQPADAAVYQELLTDPTRSLVSGVDGILAGYAMLDRKAGWQHLRDLLGNPQATMSMRYAGLRAVVFLWDYRSEVVGKKAMVEAVAQLLDQSDIADLAMDYLHRWKQWDYTDRILALQDKPSHDIPIVKRAILRYALMCPEPKAKQFVDEQRKLNPKRVADAEDLLRLEAASPADLGK